MSKCFNMKKEYLYVFIVLINIIIFCNYGINGYTKLIDYKKDQISINDFNNETLPVYFEEIAVGNNRKVYRASGLSYNIMLRNDDALLLYMNKEIKSEESNFKKRGTPDSGIFSPVYLRFLNANKSAIIIGKDKIVKKLNYYSDNNEVNKTINLYKEIRYKNIYPGVDLVFSGNKDSFNYIFYIDSECDINNILLEVDGVNYITLNADNNIVLNISGEEIVQNPPKVFIIENNKEIEKKFSFYIKDKNLIELNIN